MIPLNMLIPQELWYKIAAMIIWKTCPQARITITEEDVNAFAALYRDKGGPAIASSTGPEGLTFRLLPCQVARDLARATGATFHSEKDES